MPEDLMRLAERAFAQACRSAEIALKSPFRSYGEQPERKAALEWFKIAAALRAKEQDDVAVG